MNRETSHQQGKDGEGKAVEYLQKQQHRIVKTNFRNRIGEIDIISVKKQKLYLVEVKTWNSYTGFEPLETFSKSKIVKMRKLAEVFLCVQPSYRNYFISFCLLSIRKHKIEFYTDLF
ncbi:MAG: YraN family protein [Spirochaetota bacterium]